MQTRFSRAEICLGLGLLCALALACWGPPVAQYDHYHAFADQRAVLGLPFAMDVLSNLPFALFGVWGLWLLHRGGSKVPAGTQCAMSALFFGGLLLTAVCSSWYHLQPDDGRLVVDRLGMVVAFAGLLGMAATDRISRAAGLVVAATSLVCGPLAVAVWAASANLLPWSVFQGGGMLLVVLLAWRKPAGEGWSVPLLPAIGWYTLAKLLELNDGLVFRLSGDLVSGHTLKHVAAAMAAWRIISVLRDGSHLSHASAATGQQQPNQFALLKQRRFAPFFWTQFSGAANDNLFKFAFTVMVTYQLIVGWLPASLAGLVIGALFILPFLLFSATSGQLADKYSKTRMIRVVKNLEIGIMALAAYGFYADNVVMLLVCTFLMGLHSTLFGPVKFAYLPQVLNERELTGGNGMVEMGTFVAILLGNVAGGLLVAIPGVGHASVAIACVSLAVLGRMVAGRIPAVPATDPALAIDWNPVAQTWRNLKLAHSDRVVFRSLLGISWLWFFGAIFLSQFPSLAKEVLHGNEQVASLLLVVFSIGIGTGSLLCEVLSHRHVDIGLVPLGAIGMSVFSVDLYFASKGLPTSEVMGLIAFLQQPAHWRVMLDLALLSLFAGLYSVPLYALIQLRSPPTHRARIMAANNILNALFMIASALIAGVLLGNGFTIPQIFLFTGLVNAVVALTIFLVVPEYLLRIVARVLSCCIYRFKVRGEENIPVKGAAILVCNHVSFVDALLLMAASPRPVCFLMDQQIFKVPVLGWLFRWAKAIPIAPRAQDAAVYEAAFEAAVQVLQEGKLLCIFPEGGLTRDGRIQPFKGGIMKILERAAQHGVAVQVIPMALTNLWGSFFSRAEQGAAMVRPFRRGLFSQVGLNVGRGITSAYVAPAVLQARVSGLLRGTL